VNSLYFLTTKEKRPLKAKIGSSIQQLCYPTNPTRQFFNTRKNVSKKAIFFPDQPENSALNTNKKSKIPLEM